MCMGCCARNGTRAEVVPVVYDECEALVDVHELLDDDNYATQEAYWDAVVETLELKRDGLEEPSGDRNLRLKEAAERHESLVYAGSSVVVPLAGAYAAGFALSGNPVFLEGMLALSPGAVLPAAVVGKTYHDRVAKDRELAAQRDAYDGALETARTVRDAYE